MTAKIKVLIAEDDIKQQQDLKRLLEMYDIEVVDVASTFAETRQKADLHWDVDVIIIDNNLEDPQGTGPEAIIEVRDKKKGSFQPEFIVYTSWNSPAYYRLSLNLGVAAYIPKEDDDPVMYVKVMALSRALSLKNPKIVSEVDRIAVYSKNGSAALLEFCQKVLKTEFDSYLSAPFVILFTEGGKTQNCASNVKDLPEGDSQLYHTLQAVAHARGNPTEPFVLDTRNLEPPTDQEIALYKRLNGAAFLPIHLSDDMRLSIGILRPENRAEASVSKQEKKLCTIIAQHLRPTVLENIISLWSLLTEFRVARNSTARLCLRVGQEINDGLASDELDQLEDLANDLNNTGQYLTKLDRTLHDEEDVSIKEVVERSWELISLADDYSILRLELQGDCVVRAQRTDIMMIISRLLQWFAYRSQEIPPDIEPVIKVACETINGQANINFEDSSYRLPPALRRDLFEPFTQAIETPFPDIDQKNESTPPPIDAEDPAQKHAKAGRYMPLYLAKMLVEGRYHGFIADHSDKIKEHTYGHRILLQLPAMIRKG